MKMKSSFVTNHVHSFIPGHSPRKQSTVSSHSPLHSEPPYEGPLHSLVLCVVPLEQEAEQELQPDHSFHTPSTEKGQTGKHNRHVVHQVHIYRSIYAFYTCDIEKPQRAIVGGSDVQGCTNKTMEE